jgi:chromosome partitioning protein
VPERHASHHRGVDDRFRERIRGREAIRAAESLFLPESSAPAHIHRIGEQLPDAVDNLGGRPPSGCGSMAVIPPLSRRPVATQSTIRGDAPVTQVIAIANQKGGVGKTTTAINLAGALEEEGFRVLCIDMDPQANLTAGIDLASTEGELFTALGREQILRDALEGQVGVYEYVLIDCPPNLGLLTVNGLVAANSVIIPVQTQYYAMKGLNNLVKVINMIRMKLNRDLRILGLLPTFYDGRTNLARDMLDELRVIGDQHVFSSIVRNTVKLGEAPLAGRPITTYAGTSEAARTYRELAREVIDLGQA